MESLDLFQLVIAAHEDTGTVVNVFRDNFEHATHLAVDSLTTSCYSVNFYTFTLCM